MAGRREDRVMQKALLLHMASSWPLDNPVKSDYVWTIFVSAMQKGSSFEPGVFKHDICSQLFVPIDFGFNGVLKARRIIKYSIWA